MMSNPSVSENDLLLEDLTYKNLYNIFIKINFNGPIHPYNDELGLCHVWTSHLDKDGYPLIKINKKHRRVHRLVLIFRGYPSKGLNSCHSCDNTSCVNPEHLFFGTGQENMDDMKNKNRQGKHKGESHGMSKLTDSIILE